MQEKEIQKERGRRPWLKPGLGEAEDSSALSASQARGREKTTILDSLVEHVLYHDMDMRVLWANRAACQAAALSREQLLGRHCYEIWARSSRPCQDCPVQAARESGQPQAIEKTTPDGRAWYIQGSPVRDSGGTIVGMVELTLEITDLKRAEKALRESEERYRRITEATTDYIFTVQLERGRPVETIHSPACQAVTGYSCEEFGGDPLLWIRMVPEEDRSLVRRQAEELLSGRAPETIEHRIVRKDGQLRWVSNTPVPHYDPDGRLISYDGLIRDITERKQAEEALRLAHAELEKRVEERTARLSRANAQLQQEIEERKRIEAALRESEKTLKAILAASPVGIGLVRNRVLDWTNKAMYRIWGYEERSLLGKSSEILYPEPEEYERVGREFYRAIEREGIGQVETRWLTRDGRVIYCYLQGSPLHPADLSKGVIVAAMDITELKQAEEKLRNYQEQLRSLASELLLTEERERRRLATDLHDSIGQALAICKLKVDGLKNSASSATLAQELDEIREFLTQAIRQTRSLVFELSPPVLYELGLEQALECLSERVQKLHGIATVLEDDRQPKPLSENFRVLLFRAVQELLANIVKHARAATARICVGRDDHHIRIEVEDDGVGFEISQMEAEVDRAGKFGLFSIKERLEHLGGSLEIVSEPGKGTRVTMLAPLEDARST